MSRFIKITLDAITPCPTYNIYYNQVGPSNFATDGFTQSNAQNVLYGNIVNATPYYFVIVPDNATSIIVKDNCGICEKVITLPPKSFNDVVIESTLTNLPEGWSVCEGEVGNSVIVSGNGETFCSSTQFFSLDFSYLTYLPTYLVYQGQKVLVTGNLGESILNVLSSCENCDSRRLLWSGETTTRHDIGIFFKAFLFNGASVTPQVRTLLWDNWWNNSPYFNYYPSGSEENYNAIISSNQTNIIAADVELTIYWSAPQQFSYSPIFYYGGQEYRTPNWVPSIYFAKYPLNIGNFIWGQQVGFEQKLIAGNTPTSRPQRAKFRFDNSFDSVSKYSLNITWDPPGQLRDDPNQPYPLYQIYQIWWMNGGMRYTQTNPYPVYIEKGTRLRIYERPTQNNNQY